MFTTMLQKTVWCMLAWGVATAIFAGSGVLIGEHSHASAAENATNRRGTPETQLQGVVARLALEPIGTGPPQDPAKVALGEALFFDKILSGNRDIACATCHHPLLHGGDGLPLSIGTLGRGLGPARAPAEGYVLIPRNAPELFNRGSPLWHTMFWDGRVVETSGYFGTPAGDQLPDGLDNALAVQAMFPVTSRDEMRGHPAHDAMAPQAPGAAALQANDLAEIADGEFTAIWSALMKRLLAIPAYRTLFRDAYPDTPADALGFAHAANALAAYEIAAFSFGDSPWDRFLAGDPSALSAEATQGALLFYGKARCATCHSGTLLTDQAYHNIGVPQLGPGKDESGLDYGRQRESGDAADRFAFRTPPLRNVALTGPWMHNGAYATLNDAVRHHLDAADSLAAYTGAHLRPDVQATLRTEPAVVADQLGTLDPWMQDPPRLSAREIDQILAFLHAQTSPSALSLGHLVPDSVPSGLPVWD